MRQWFKTFTDIFWEVSFFFVIVNYFYFVLTTFLEVFDIQDSSLSFYEFKTS